MHPDPPLLSPDDAARHKAVVGFDHQHEAFGNPDGGGHLECGAGFGKVADRAVDGGPAAKRNPARLQKPSPWCYSVLVHHLDLRLITEFSTPRLLSRYHMLPSHYNERWWPAAGPELTGAGH